MDTHTTLNMLLSSLFTNNSLHNWSIFEDNSDYINVRIRFTKHEDINTVQNASYRRISEAQARRNRERAARHRDTAARRPTRIQNLHLTPEIPRYADGNVGNSETTPVALPVSPELVLETPEIDTHLLEVSSPVIHAEPQTCGEKPETDHLDTSNVRSDCIHDRIIENSLADHTYHDQLDFAPDNTMLSDHLTDANTSMDNIGCCLCPFRLRETFSTKMRRTLQCKSCSRYICASCYRSKPVIHNHNTSCDSKSYRFIT